MPKKHRNQVYILLHLQVDQYHTVVITQVVSLYSCDLFLFILVTHMKLVDYYKIAEENFNFVAQDILERTWLKTPMVFPEPWVKLDFSCFFSFLHQFIDLKKKTRGQLIQSTKTNIKYKLCGSQNYLYDCYYLISKTKTYAKRAKRPINTHWLS